jgi:hypothetical protein
MSLHVGIILTQFVVKAGSTIIHESQGIRFIQWSLFSMVVAVCFLCFILGIRNADTDVENGIIVFSLLSVTLIIFHHLGLSTIIISIALIFVFIALIILIFIAEIDNILVVAVITFSGLLLFANAIIQQTEHNKMFSIQRDTTSANAWGYNLEDEITSALTLMENDIQQLFEMMKPSELNIFEAKDSMKTRWSAPMATLHEHNQVYI